MSNKFLYKQQYFAYILSSHSHTILKVHTSN